jgi:4-diphosphocytidyl-2-C-methyl-D-erythritol kinase
MIVFPNAKINLGLRITGKRPDGYHDIETIFYPVGLYDALEFVVSEESPESDILTVTGINTGTEPEDNLVMKTARRIRENYLFPFLKIHLHKVIPVGAGLGGGSSDAAYFLKAINRFFRLMINDEKLRSLALEIGSDCPFFIDPNPSLAFGRGEILKPVSPVLKGFYLVLINPGIGINTREAYQNSHPKISTANLSNLSERPVTEWKHLITNDFEDYAFNKYPVIGEIKEKFYQNGALYSSMSGSGSSVFGIFPEKPKLPDDLDNYVIWQGRM